MHEPRPLNLRGCIELATWFDLDLFIVQLLLDHAYLPVTRASLEARDMAPAAGFVLCLADRTT